MPLVQDRNSGQLIYIAFEPGGVIEGAIAWWKLEGYDTFDGEPYPLDGVYGTEAAARRAAQDRLDMLERTQPTAASGGQADLGIQDRVYVVRPDGTKYRYTGTAAQEEEA